MNATAVRVESDTSTLLRALSKTFTRSTVVLSELLQNARRARASAVEITVTDTDITVADDGSGIADFAVLLAVAKSGWDAAVQASDAPYGMGWLSCLFVCDRIEVSSLGQGMVATTEDLLALKPVAITPQASDGRTLIRLCGHRLGETRKVLDTLRTIVAGFPLPVVVNGQEMARPHRLDPERFIETPIGHITPGVLEGQSIRQFYLQGLPIACEAHNPTRHSYNDGEVVHLASPQFEGRLPERDSLIEPEANAKRITEILRETMRAHLTARLEQMGQAPFLTTYGRLAQELDMRELLNGLDAIPAHWVSEFDGEPQRAGSGGHCYQPINAPIPRETLSARGVYAPETEREDYETDLIAEHVVFALKGFVDNHIPEWHWAKALVVPLVPEDFRLVPGATLGEDSLEIFYDSITLRLVETLHVQRIEPADAPRVAISAHYDCEDNVLYATPEVSAATAVWQVSDFEDGDDHYQEHEQDDAIRRFAATRDVLLHSDPSSLLATFLDKGLPWKVPELLRGKSFTVSLNPEGKATVAVA